MGPLKRYQQYLLDEGLQNTGDFNKAVAKLELVGSVKKPRANPHKKRLERVSFQDQDWRKLYAAVVDDPAPEARVLQVEMETGVRVGDVLRLTRSRLRAAFTDGHLLLEVKGGRERTVPIIATSASWVALWEAWPAEYEIVAEWLSPRADLDPEVSRAAYAKVRRHMLELGTQLGLHGRIHTHRCRRTVAVRALASTKDVHAVSQLLGHASVKTTEGYVDELRVADVNQIQATLLNGLR